MQAHLGLRMPDKQRIAHCARIERKDGQVFGFTDHDFNITISGWLAPDLALNGTYRTLSGLASTDVSTTSALNVDNMEVVTPQVDITAQSMHAGQWDFAKVTIFLVNYRDLTMGPHYLRKGWIGELSTEILSVRSEIRGLMQAYSQTLGVLTSPTCRNDFGDARCGVALGPFTVTGAIDDANPDNMTLYDAARTEAGVSTGIAITGITNANPGVVTMLNGSLALVDQQSVSLSGIVGMPRLNKVTVARFPVGNTFKLSIDTTDTLVYGTYTSGGIVTPLGGGRSIFDGARITFTSGLNAGLSEDVGYYAPGQITLALPMTFPVNGQLDTYGSPIQDTYTMVRGCGKQFLTNCIADYANGVNFNGEPWIGGNDKLIQVGRR